MGSRAAGNEKDTNQPPPRGLLQRPVGSLLHLPVAYRWEFTRRHPYYLSFWEMAHRHHAGLLANSDQEAFGKLAVAGLWAIGFSGDPPPPTTGPDALHIRQLGSAWARGAVAPQTFRSMAAMMILALPPEAKVRIATLLAEAAVHGTETPHDVIFKLHDAPEPELDGTPNGPIVGVNLEASKQAILDAINELVDRWKREKQIPDRRRGGDERYEEYLKVWDLYEGWTGGNYDVLRERSFKVVASETGSKPQTVADRYYAAFRLISGHEYSFENWFRLFAVIKLAGVHGPRSAGRRRSGGPRRRSDGVSDVTETTLMGSRERAGGGFLDGHASGRESPDEVAIVNELRDLLSRGLTDEEIVRRMEFADPEGGILALRSIRQHWQEHPKS